MEKIDEKLLKGLVKEGDKVLVGVSGGADSMCLLWLLSEYRQKVGFSLCAMHVNHGLRGLEADRDQKLVEDFCAKLKVECVVKKIDVRAYCQKTGATTEEGARILRYDAFNKVMKEKDINLLAVAHNQNDRVETILMHILRGGSIKGAVGMQLKSANIIRPLLNVSREEIEQFDNAHHIPFIVDSSNNDLSYTRNYIRKEILPRLKTIYPNLASSLTNFSSLAQKDNDFIESQLPLEMLKTAKNEVKITEEVSLLAYPLASRLVILAAQKLGVYKDVELKHVEAVLGLFSKKSGDSVNLTHGLVAHRDYDGITLEKKVEKGNFAVEFGVKNVDFADFGEICVEIADNFADFAQNERVHYVDMDKMPQSAIWRTFKAGDYFCPVNSKNKKLSDYFTDKKIERRKRLSLPVLADKNTILVVAGLGISEKVKIDKSTKSAYRIKYNRA